MKFLRFKIFFTLLFSFLLADANPEERSLNNLDWQFRKKGDKKWCKATVPGTVHTNLLANKLIPDPYFGDNEKRLQWIENEDWEYMALLRLSEEELNQQHIELKFDGLDTYAKVYLNDSLVLLAENMFRSYTIEAKKYLKPGKNKIFILFENVIDHSKSESSKLNYTLPGEEKIFTRKAQYQYGWDWGPRFVTCGIWKNVSLHFWNQAKFGQIHYSQWFINDSTVELNFYYEIKVDSILRKVKVNILLDTPTTNDKNIFISHRSEFKNTETTRANFIIKNPKKWWCNGLGTASMYRFKFELLVDKKPLDNRYVDLGIRSIELIQNEDSVGKSFSFKLNGVPLFAKGANYIPPDNFLPRVKASHYKTIIQNAVSANMNMLRVWGGGVYADDEFYNECDKNGIMVWQDFMFACAMYPASVLLSDNVKNEMIDQIKRLQNHPCLALWCGNNEIDEGWKNWGWQKQYHYSYRDSLQIYKNYQQLFENLLPYYLKVYDPLRATNYIASSPENGWGRKESLTRGDLHYWGVWWGMEPFEMYKKKVGRFVSEYGFQGMPDFRTLKKIAADSSLNLNSVAIKNHQKHPTGYQTIAIYMARDYKIPKKFEDYIYVSQLLQAKGMKTAIEAHRRAKPICMGTLYWQLNDCWPVTSWSSVDYYNNWKAAHYQIKRSFAEKIISVNETDSALEIYVINDGMKKIYGRLAVKLLDFAGIVLWKNSNPDELQHIEANGSQLISTIKKSELKEFDLGKLFLTLDLKLEGDDSEISSIHYFAKPKNIPLTKPEITLSYISPNKFSIHSNVLAKDVFLSIDGYKKKAPDSLQIHFSDNYFDLLPGEMKIISTNANLNGDFYRYGIKVKSLYDAP